MNFFLHNSKCYRISFLLITGLILLSSTTSFAVTKTWAGGTGVGKDWTSGGNWSGGTAPVAGDDIVFNTAGTITFSTMPGSDIAYNSITISTGVVTVEGVTNITLTLGGNPDTDFLISGGGAIFTIGTNVNVTIAPGSSANISGELFVNNGSNYNSAGLNTVTSVFGTINNGGSVTTATAGNLLFNSFTAYVHSQDGGVIPTATWDATSNCIITGLINTNITSGDGQSFGNLTYNCAGMTGVITMSGTVTIAGNLNITNTGSSQIQMTSGSITVGGELEVGGAFIISNTTDRTLTVNSNVLITGGGNLNLCNGGAGNVGTLIVGGNFTNFGAITESGTGSGTINFSGGLAQNFNQSGAFVNIINIIVNNTAGVTFINSATINGTLTLTNGRLIIPINQTITIANGNVIGGTGFGSSKHIVTEVNTGTGAKGFLRINNMAASTPYLIPVGNGTSYLPVTLTPDNVNGYDICVFNGMTNDGEPNGTPFTAGQKLNIVDAVWTVNLISGAAGAGVTMTTGWPAALEGATFSLFTAPQIGISHWDNPTWGNCSGTGDNTANTSTRAGITLFSPFGVGKTPYVLPIKFGYLNAAKGNGYNTLYWKAACSSTEVNFSIERSTDGRNFNAVHSINASQARCAQPFDYVDNVNVTGAVFYRIKATEITGLITYSAIVSLSGQQTDMQITAVLPNPVINQAQLSINTTKKDHVELLVISMDGKVLQSSRVQLVSGTSIINLDVAALQKGIYMIKGTFSNGQTNTLKFTKQ